MRKSGGHDDSPEGQGGQSPRPGGREMMMRANRKMYGSVEVMDSEAEAGAKRFRVESHNTRHQVGNVQSTLWVIHYIYSVMTTRLTNTF